MDIVHIDPGYGKGFTGGNITSIESEEYNPVNGVAFISDAGSSIRFSLPPLIGNIPSGYYSKRMTIRFSFYCPSAPSQYLVIESPKYGAAASNSYAMIQVMPNSCTFKLNSTQETISTGKATAPGFYNFAFTVSTGIKNQSSSYRFAHHIYCELEGAAATISIDDQVSSTQFANLKNILFSEYSLTFPEMGDKYYISNVIATGSVELSTGGTSGSSLPLLSYEALPVRLPLGAPVTTFTAGDNGEYIGTETGQTLLQSINASDVITKYGAKSNVIGLASYGNPCYRVGSGITQASGISESDGTITSHGTTELSTETDAAAFVAWETPETILSDIDGLKVGWQI